MQKQPLSGYSLGWRWFLVTLIGFGLGGVVGTIAAWAGLYLLGVVFIWIGVCASNQSAIGCLLSGLTIGGGLGLGISVGVAQWWLLRCMVARSLWWIVASALGWAGIAFTLSLLFYIPIAAPITQIDGSVKILTMAESWPQIWPVALWVIGAGLLMGFFQWLILNTYLRHSFMWLVLHGVLMVLVLIVIVLWVRGAGGVLGVGIFLLGFGLFYGLLTGLMLAWNFRSREIPPEL